MFSSNIISCFILSKIFNIYLKHIQKYKSHYQFKANLDKAIHVDAIQKILDSNKVRVPKVFVNFCSICMILGISAESIHIICDQVQAEVKEFCTTTFLFNFLHDDGDGRRLDVGLLFSFSIFFCFLKKEKVDEDVHRC